MTLKQKFQNEIETESTASLNMGDVLSWGVLIFGEGQGCPALRGSGRDGDSIHERLSCVEKTVENSHRQFGFRSQPPSEHLTPRPYRDGNSMSGKCAPGKISLKRLTPEKRDSR